MKFLKFTLPHTDQKLFTEPNETRENVLENYCDPETDTVDDIHVEEVEMTQEEFDALPEFEG